MSTTKFVLRLGKKNREKEYPIYLQYIHDDEKFLLATGWKCEPRNWDKKHGKPKKDSKLEDTLDVFKKRFKDNAVYAVVGDPKAYKVKDAWTEFLKEEKKNQPEAIFKGSLLACWNEYIEFISQALYKGKPRTAGTVRNNTNSRIHLRDFLEEKKRMELKPEKFTVQDYQLFEGYLVKKLTKDSEGKFIKALSPNSISKIKKHFKSFLRWHVNRGGLLGFNISLIEYSESPGVKIALSETELNKIAQEQFVGQLSLARDFMVLQSCTGVRISDLKRLCENFNEDRTAFRIKVKKTGKYILVPVLPLAKEVLIRREYKFPYLPEQTYREGIKAIYKKLYPKKTIEIGEGDNMKKVFVHEEISSHDMVRTFVNIAAQKGISIPTISVLTGKSIQVITKHYLNEDKDHAAQELLEKFDLSPLRIAN